VKKMRFRFLFSPLFLSNNYILILRTFISSILNPRYYIYSHFSF
jgi:hypothetical protein